MKTAIIALVMLLAGCASTGDIMGYQWSAQPVVPPITTEPVMVVTPTYEYYVRRCGVYYGHKGACAERRYDLNPPQCWIVSYRDIQDSGYLWEHEVKHCKGYNHDN